MKSEFLRVPFFLLLLLIFTFGAHLTLNHFLFNFVLSHYIIEAYVLNYLLAVAEFIIVYFLLKRITEHLGYIFIFSSALKFMVAYLIFHPLYKEDGEINKAEFTTIFIPYIASLIVITFQVLKVLKKHDKNHN